MKKVVIDARMVGPIPHGFGRYVQRLAQGLALLEEKGPFAYEPIFLTGAETPGRVLAGFQTVRVGAKFLSPFEMAEIPVLLKRLGADLYHSPTFSSLPYSPVPWIVTVHDLNHLTYGGRKERFYYEGLLKRFARKAQALVTVSEFSRAEIAAWSGVEEKTIEIVYNSMDPEYLYPQDEEKVRTVLEKHGLSRGKFFLVLSNPKPHKNVAMLVDAYANYRDARGKTALPLVLSLGGFEGKAGVLSLGGLRDEESRVLLATAAAVLFPSLYEGFGLPPVEAASLGSPVVASDIPPHREGLSGLGENEALWLDPNVASGWTEAMIRAEEGALPRVSTESRAKLVGRFDPRKMGRDMDRIYRRVLGV